MGRPKKSGKCLSHQEMVARNKIVRKSKVGNPVKGSWEVFDQTRKAMGESFTRKAAIDAALKAGVAFYTARTQYQEWKQAGDRDRATTERLYGTSNPHIQR